ncbi:MAG: hypothetical protein RL136_1161 [Planctomycetota bacterium]
MKRTFLAACVVLASNALAHSHPPDAFDASTSRMWRNTRTGESVEGSFLFARAGKVGISTASGELAAIALADLAGEDRAFADARIDAIRAMNERIVGDAADAAKPPQAAVFDAFAPFVKTRFDERWLYVESDGLPHAPLETRMMVGIRAWQQQVPLPQDYTGANAWQIPLKPELADKPILGKSNLMKGAVALAANGIPIFNALNNRGVDSFSIGELDEFGGHCGRADDYHYHAAPLAIEKVVGKGMPIAYALDGFPIYGLFDPKAKAGDDLACPCGSHEPLDEINGHFCEVPKGEGFGGGTRSYHYHASTTYPYINGGLRGRVELSGPGPENEVVPQAHANPIRPALQALRGARITGFEQTGEKAWSLTYEVAGKSSKVKYRIESTGKVVFDFIGADGVTRTEEYDARGRGGRRGGQADGGGRPPRPREGGAPTPPTKSVNSVGLSLACSSLDAAGLLDLRCTCDGEGIAPGFEWSGLPNGTKSIAIVMHHIPPGDEDTHVYMVVYGLPATATGLREGARDIGKWGVNSVDRRASYAPPCSQGRGEKVYTATVYALSAEPKPERTREGVTRAELLKAIERTTLGTASVDLRYARATDGDDARPQRGRGDRQGEQDGRRGGQGGRRGGGQGGGGQAAGEAGGGRGGLLAQMTAFKTEVPATDHEVILVQPTAGSVTASVRASTDRLGAIEFARTGAEKGDTTERIAMKAGIPASFKLTGLSPDAAYTYRFVWWPREGAPPVRGDEREFHTPRTAGAPFRFVIQADSHLDQGVTPQAYERTLANMVASKPDFLVDLGDTFMTDKRGQDYERALAQYDAQRYYFGLACHAMPLFMVLGNHDGEKGDAARGMGAWSYNQRVARFPAPVIDGTTYTGATAMENGRGANYYAFEWGDALIVVLDPFWSTTERMRGGGGRGQGGGGQGGGGQGGRGEGGGGPEGARLSPVDTSWSSTLGRAQYDWLAETLAKSKAKQKFVFIHHLVGGIGGSASRGGVESAPYFEWGGRNADGSDGFAARRPGWPMPIHQLLVKHGVSAVFHGHDHLYVHSQLDGVHYQCVPQPGNLAGNTRSAEEYGYTSGTLLGSPGHLRVSLAADGTATVEFVRTALEGSSPADGRGRRGGQAARPEANGSVVDSYEIKP